ncbi:GTP cyclohydrolase I FolE [Alphaproteobacteria bacterium]|jgi:GTP cyclohydrolase I|nr:GTP cyclohydrolase I FolE [Alphaproteobacteria bacterium]MBT5799100.1 GTP cyclohydrolase I FolE [Alphaproteobacteria bacterium]MDA9190484.1 GTP cyclohydrolase I FolE [Alphaproteobacteria bacterium]MDC0394266.1 GTP cyclohydrolase I FolE [Alphaproteobacteria bacterium]MDC3311467.1 GTP cyclohydrolase I FolE [Alphaproteobacteria bacterium]
MTPYDTTDLTKNNSSTNKPSRDEAEKAVEILLRWAGDNPQREGLVDTPARVVRAFEEFFAGYSEDPEQLLERTFEEVEGYDDIVMLRDISMQSHCEHHLVPILGKAHIAYLPDTRVVGISKLARVLDSYSRRLQTQETMTSQVANAIQNALKPKGVAILIDAQHQCMTTRGVKKPDVSMVTTQFTGEFKKDPSLRDRFYRHIELGR